MSTSTCCCNIGYCPKCLDVNLISFRPFERNQIELLANFNPKTHYLVINTSKSHYLEEITILAKERITCFQKFLKLFNRGILANTRFHLLDVCKYLSNYDPVYEIKKSTLESTVLELSSAPQESTENKAFLTILNLAKKAQLKNESFLFNKMTTPFHESLAGRS